MPDISMCGDHRCPSRKGCYRYMATPSEFRQAYGMFGRPDDAEKCEHHWPVEGRRVRDLGKVLD